MSTPTRTVIGTPEVPGSVVPGDVVVYLPDVPLWGTMRFHGKQKIGERLICEADDGSLEVFEPHEISTPEAVATGAAKALG